MTALRQVMVLTRDIGRAVQFYSDGGIGLPLLRRTETWAELMLCPFPPAASTMLQQLPWQPPRLAIKLADTEAAMSTGYSPFLNFVVVDVDDTVQRLLRLGATMDGPIKYPVHGKVASVRSPDGQMVGLYEHHDWKAQVGLS